MSEEPTPRQVLYALVAGAFVGVVAILTIGAAVAGLVPPWWSSVLGVALVVVAVWIGSQWRRTGAVLTAAIGLFVVWLVGTLIFAV